MIYFPILAVLGTWRITHLLSQEAGPADVLRRARQFAGSGFLGQLFGCFYCMSVWVAGPFAFFIGHGWKESALLWPALSGGAILLERLSAERAQAMRGFYVEEQEKEHVLR